MKEAVLLYHALHRFTFLVIINRMHDQVAILKDFVLFTSSLDLFSFYKYVTCNLNRLVHDMLININMYSFKLALP